MYNHEFVPFPGQVVLDFRSMVDKYSEDGINIGAHNLKCVHRADQNSLEE